LTAHLVFSEVIGAFVLPHGGIALDPSHFKGNATQKQWAQELHETSKKVGQMIDQLKPDLIFLSTPHGIADFDKFMFYQNDYGEGTAETEGNYAGYHINVSFNSEITSKIVSYLLSIGQKVSNVTAFSQGEPFPLRWGEVIPLYFIPNVDKYQIITISQPSRRYDHSPEMVPELITLGKNIFNYLDKISNKRIVILISADLAHTHDPDGPYGYSPAAAPFDKACGDWVQTLNGNYLTQVASSLVLDAKSCGFTGLVLLHGALSLLGTDHWQSVLYSNHYPSYYGMLVASFLKKSVSTK